VRFAKSTLIFGTRRSVLTTLGDKVDVQQIVVTDGDAIVNIYDDVYSCTIHDYLILVPGQCVNLVSKFFCLYDAGLGIGMNNGAMTVKQHVPLVLPKVACMVVALDEKFGDTLLHCGYERHESGVPFPNVCAVAFGGDSYGDKLCISNEYLKYYLALGFPLGDEAYLFQTVRQMICTRSVHLSYTACCQEGKLVMDVGGLTETHRCKVPCCCLTVNVCQKGSCVGDAKWPIVREFWSIHLFWPDRYQYNFYVNSSCLRVQTVRVDDEC